MVVTFQLLATNSWRIGTNCKRLNSIGTNSFSSNSGVGTNRVGTDRVGTNRVGTNRIGTDRVGTIIWYYKDKSKTEGKHNF